MARAANSGQSDAFELGSLESHGKLWGFRFSSAETSLTLTYRDESAARRARMLIFEAIKEVARPSVARAARGVAADAENSADTRIGRFRQWIHILLEEGQLETIVGRLIEGFLVSLIVANVIAVALETIPSISAAFGPELFAFERASLFVYTAEYLLRVWSCVEDPRIGAKGGIRGRILYALRPLMIVDFMAFAPSLLGVFFGIDLRVLRIFRLFRLLKLARYSQALQALLNVLFVERSALLASAILLLAFTCLTGELMHLAEGTVQPKTLGTMPGAMYWALTTLTTVGYGDISPITPLGKLIAGATMIAGLALFSLPVGIIANGFVTGISRRRFAITLTMLKRQPLLQGLSVESLTDILEAPTSAIIREHAQLIVEGREATEFHLIVSGSARAEIGNEELELGPGDIVGAEALLHRETYRQTVTAETVMRVIVFSGDELRRLCRKFPIMGQRVDAELERRGTFEQRTAGPPPKGLEAEISRLQKLVATMMLEKLG